MTHAPAQLALRTERCDRCGKCVSACRSGALKVGVSYIYVEWRNCQGCLACVKACDRGAIVARSSAVAHVVADTPAPVITSRAEAKAARKAAALADRKRRREDRGQAKHEKVHSIVNARAEAIRADGMVSWTLPDAGVVLAVMLLSFVAKDAILSAGPVRLMPASGQAVARTLVLGAFYLVQLWTLGYLAARRGTGLVPGFGLGRLGRSWGAKLSTAGLVAGLLLATRAVSTVYGGVVQALGWRPPVHAEGDLTALFGAGGPGLALSVLMVVVIGPLAEELAFRGVIMQALGARWGKWPAVLLSAGVFAAYHFTPWLLVPTFVLGASLGWLAWERRSLWPAVVLHALYNATAVAAAFWVAAR